MCQDHGRAEALLVAHWGIHFKDKVPTKKPKNFKKPSDSGSAEEFVAN